MAEFPTKSSRNRQRLSATVLRMRPTSLASSRLRLALAPLLADPALRQRCGARARQRFEAGFTENAMFDKTVATYREACGGRA